MDALYFLTDHQFEVCEYDGYEEDLSKIPCPTEEPVALLQKFLHVLRTLGG